MNSLIRNFEKIVEENRIPARQEEESDKINLEDKFIKKEISEKDWKKLKEN